MNRIDQIFQDARQAGQRPVMPFLTAGDPDVDTTIRLLEAIQDAGAPICELGVPFSDPIADGPIIQASMQHALDNGFKPAVLFDRIKQLRPKLKIGLVAMVSYSIVHRMGLDSFVKRAADAGFDGFIFPDLALEESAPARAAAAEAGLIFSMLIAPTTPPERAEKIARACTGFIYLVARAGVTGVRSDLPSGLVERIDALKKITELPIAVGFGVSNAQHVRQVTAHADAAIVGSALMRRIADNRDNPDNVVKQVAIAVSELVEGAEKGLETA